jgi:hypothetical protein
MIIVEYYPAGENSPLPGGSREYEFETFSSFLHWVGQYVCINCLVDFTTFHEEEPKTLADWLDMGCGCEIGITDSNDMIFWDTEMKLPDNFEQYLKDNQ